MTNLNDVLLAMSNIPVVDPIAEIWGRGLQGGGYTIIEYTGALPLTIKANGEPLIDYRIYGNTVQNGTPTPENPILPIGCGERTENLFETESNMLSSLNWDLNPAYSTHVFFINYKLSDAVTQELKNGQHTCSIFRHFTDEYTPNLLVCAFTPTPAPTVNQEYRILTNQGVTFTRTFDFSQWQDIYLIIGYGNGFSTEEEKQSKIDELFTNWRISIVAGSTAPESYESYGYNLPILSNSTVTNIYLGEVETTRRIKKLVLTGDESSYIEINRDKKIYAIRGVFNQAPELLQVGGFCTHYKYNNAIDNLTQNMSNGDFVLNKIVDHYSLTIMDNSFSTDTEFRQYVRQQYAAGTPVTVWYVLAEPETGIVNEPLMKIGNYSDTIDSTQANVQIPTSKGTTVIDYDGTTKPSQMYIKYLGR